MTYLDYQKRTGEKRDYYLFEAMDRVNKKRKERKEKEVKRD